LALSSLPLLSKSVFAYAPGKEMPTSRSRSNHWRLKGSRTAGEAALTAAPSTPSASAVYAPAIDSTFSGAMMGPWKNSMV